jgi:hypothetical protein
MRSAPSPEAKADELVVDIREHRVPGRDHAAVVHGLHALQQLDAAGVPVTLPGLALLLAAVYIIGSVAIAWVRK